MKKICALMLTVLAMTIVGCQKKSQELKNGAEVESAAITGYASLGTTVDQASNVITYTVPLYAREWDLAALEATFVVSEGASWALKTGEKIDWSSEEFTIVVTSESKATKTEYAVVRAYDSSTPDKTISVINSYNGDIDVTLSGGTPIKMADQKIILKRLRDNHLSMLLKDFKFGSMVVGDVMVENIATFDGQSEGLFILTGSDSTLVNIGAETNVLINVKGTYNKTTDVLDLTILIGGVAGMDISAAFKGAVLQDPTATEPIFATVKGSKVLHVQDFKDGNLVYYADGALDKSAFADVVPNIILPSGATMKWYQDKPFDPTSEVQYFDVVSKDGSKSVRYNVTREGIDFNNITQYSFEDWTEQTQEAPYNTFYTPLPEVLQVPNQAVIMLKAFGMYVSDGEYPATIEGAGKIGNAAKLITIDTKGGQMWPGGPSAPKVTSGSMFTGSFDMMAAMSDPMLSTLFGLPYNGKKITSVKGWYKYTPGTQMYNNLVAITGVDKPVISCIVYDVSDNYAVTLTGHDTYTSSRIIGMGVVTPAATTAFTEFNFNITYTQDYTPSNTNVYKVAFICSASVNGDKFIGAPGSTLIIDEVELVTQ